MVETEKRKFIATVRRSGGIVPVGQINSKELLKFIGRKVVVKVREAGKND